MQDAEFTAVLKRLTTDLFETARKDNLEDRTKPWTKALKLLLKGYGDEHGFVSEYTNPDEGISEFMVDFLWWDRRDAQHQRMVLAVESEWHNFRVYETDTAEAYASRVTADFYKLVVIKSKYKLMVLDSKSRAMLDRVVRELNGCVAEYADHSNGELYFVLDFGAGDQVTSYRLSISQDGSTKDTFAAFDL